MFTRIINIVTYRFQRTLRFCLSSIAEENKKSAREKYRSIAVITTDASRTPWNDALHLQGFEHMDIVRGGKGGIPPKY